MKRSTAAATLAIAALSLSACTGGTSTPEAAETSAASAPVAIAATSAPAKASAPTTKAANDISAKDRQQWADEKMTEYLNGRGAHSFDAFDGSALGAVESWRAPKIGHLVIEIGGDSWKSGDDLEYVAEAFMASVGWDSQELSEVEVIAPASNATSALARDDMSNANPWAK